MIAAPSIHQSPKDRIRPRAPALGRPFNRDRLHMVPRDEAAVGAFAMLDKVQQEAPELALASIALLFAAMCERFSMNPQDAHAYGHRIMQPQQYHKKGNTQIEAMHDFAKTQWQGRPL